MRRCNRRDGEPVVAASRWGFDVKWRSLLVLAFPLSGGCVEEHPDWPRTNEVASTGSSSIGSTSADETPGPVDTLETGTMGASSSTSASTGPELSDTASGSTSGGSGSDSSGGSSTGGANTIDYEPLVCTCVGDAVLDPAECEDDAGLGQIKVDLEDGATGQVQRGFFTIPLDDQFDGLDVVGLTLEITVSNDQSADTNDSGSVFVLDPFVFADLYTDPLPQPVGGAAVEPAGASVGPVSQRQTVRWDLPTSLLTPNTTLYLGLFPNSTNGARYWSCSGPDGSRPRLRVEYSPT